MENNHYIKYTSILLKFKSVLSIIGLSMILIDPLYREVRVTAITLLLIPVIGLYFIMKKWKNGYIITMLTSAHSITLLITNISFIVIGLNSFDIGQIINFILEVVLIFYSYKAFLYSDYNYISREYVLNLISQYKDKIVKNTGININKDIVFLFELGSFIIISYIDFNLLFLYCILIIWINNTNWRNYGFDQDNFKIKILIYGICLGCIIYGISSIMQPFYYYITNGSSIDNFSHIKNNLQSYIEAIIYTWTFSSILQEVVFRGYLINRIIEYFNYKQYSRTIGLVGSSILFGLIHLYQGWVGVLSAIVFGLLIGWTYLARKNIWLLVVIHSVVNTIIYTQIFLG